MDRLLTNLAVAIAGSTVTNGANYITRDRVNPEYRYKIAAKLEM